MTTGPDEVPGILAPPPLLYAVPLALGIYLQHVRPQALLPAGAGRPLGIILVAFGFIGMAGVLAFRRAGTSPNPWRPTTSLVLTGPYRWTRNPMYVGMTLLYLGTTAWVNTVWPLIPLPFILLVMQRGVIAREEAYLDARFGDDYRSYKGKVRRWI